MIGEIPINNQKTVTNNMKTFAWAFVTFLWALWPPFSLCELIVNVSRNRTHPLDGIVRQVITGNSSTELVTVEYKEVVYQSKLSKQFLRFLKLLYISFISF